jgi:Carboxypeptidase regulatory-like domain
VTVIAPSAGGYLTVWADNALRPTTANVNFSAGRSQADQVYAPVGANGKVDFYNGSSGHVRVLADVSGYFSSTNTTPAGAFVSTNPTRVVDTRTSQGARPVAARGTAAVHLLGVGPVPGSGVSAVVFTVTAVSPSAGGYFTAYAGGTARPATSNLDFAAHETVGNLVVSQVGNDGAVDLYNGSAGTSQFVLDVQGYFISGSPRVTGAYVPLTPTRVLAQSPTAAQTVTNAAGAGFAGPDPIVISAAEASVINVTATGVTASGYLLAYGGGAARTNVSTASVTRGLVTAGSAVVSGDAIGAKVYNGAPGSLRLTNDLFGYYLAAPGLGSISGRVTDATTSTGIPGVQVIVYYESDVEPGDVAYAEYARAATAADGSYALPQLYAGIKYKVCFDALGAAQPDPSTGFISACYDGVPWDSPGAGFFDTNAKDVGVSSDSPTTIDAKLTRTAAGRVTGRTTLASGAALAGVQIDFFVSGGSSTEISRVVTDGTGEYSAVLPPDTYPVCFNTGNLPAGKTPYGYAMVCPDAPVTVTRGGVVELNQVIPQNEAVVGRVLTSTGAAVHGGEVAVFNRDGNAINTALLTPSGSFTVPFIAPGDYRVCFSSDPTGNPPYGLVDECYQNVPWNSNGLPSSDATPVRVVDGANTTVNATLPYAGAISGTVTTRSGSAVNNVFVEAFNPTTSAQIARGFTDSTGRYTLSGLPPSNTGYALCFNPGQASPTGESAQCYSGVPWDEGGVPKGTTAVSVTARADHDKINAVLSP